MNPSFLVRIIKVTDPSNLASIKPSQIRRVKRSRSYSSDPKPYMVWSKDANAYVGYIFAEDFTVIQPCDDSVRHKAAVKPKKTKSFFNRLMNW